MTAGARTDRIELTVVGTWHRFSTDHPATLKREVHSYARALAGRRDHDASVRAQIRSRLRAAVEAANEHRATAMLVCEELAPGVPLPAVVTVFAPTPVLSEEGDRGLGALRAHLARTAAEGKESAVVEVPAAGRSALRIAVLDESTLEPGVEATRVRGLRIDYWVALPDGERACLVSCYTPLGDIPHAMVRFFDAIVARARIVTETRVA